MSRGRSLLGLLIGLAGLAAPVASEAQLVGSGSSFSAIAMGVRGTSVAFDSRNQVYLAVGAYGTVRGRVVRPNGTFAAADFQISTTPGTFAHYPRVAYSPDADGERGAFLVVWHEGGGSGSNFVKARLVSATSGLLGAEIQLGSEPTWWEAAPAIDYSTVSRNFLVAWQLTTYRIKAARVSAAGAIIDRLVVTTPVINTGERDPSVAYNPATDQYLVAYTGWAGGVAHVTARLLSAATGVLSVPQVLSTGTATYISDASFSPATGTYLVAWFQNPGGILGRLVGANGLPTGGLKPLSTRFGSYDSLGLAYNGVTGTYGMVGHDSRSFENGAVEISAAGAPGLAGIVTNARGARGNFYPKVAASTSAKQWMLTTAHDFAALYGQLFTSSSSGGTSPPPPPPPPPPSPNPPPAPPPAPPSGLTAVEKARADFNSDGSSDILWQNGADGGLAVWRMSGENLVKGLAISPGAVPDTQWKIVASADINQDGRPDILWQHDLGHVAVWFMRGETQISGQLLTSTPLADLGWRIVAAGDVDGDGSADILWQHTDGRVAVWYMHGPRYRFGDVIIDLANADWRVVGASDTNGDGRLDLVWRHASGGEVAVWFMRGLVLLDGVLVDEPSPGASWRLVSVVDVDRDGRSDFLWQNGDTGDLGAWLMNGATARGLLLNPPAVGDTNWKIVGPK